VIALKYTVFAIIASFANLFFQYVSFNVYDGYMALYIAMFVGTLAGLITKYILDRNFIFYTVPRDKKNEVHQFIFYSITGAFITLIFWILEIVFDLFFDNVNAKYLGAMLGLAIGYTTKYFLDKKYVFKELK